MRFLTSGFFMNQFPQAPEYPFKGVLSFFLIFGDICSSRCTTGVFDIGGEWKKSSIQKVSIILFEHLWVVELT